MQTIDPEKLAELLRRHQPAVALTGAGISVESGIPDFRSRGGLWERFDPMEYATIQAFRRHPAKVWTMLREMDALLVQARPNPAHLALAALEAAGLLAGVITQNVDNLHQAAGSRKVVEYHGNAHRFVCLACGRLTPREGLDFASGPPSCDCGGLIKPDVVFFGEPIPPAAQKEALDLASSCALMLVIGTSAEVAPASYLPFTAKDHGALIVESNLETTNLSRRLTDYFLSGPAGRQWPRVVKKVLDEADAHGPADRA
ncbi:MAG: NAD-dependent protein deacylase [Deltaproteobacteria bacterium]|nr:NAD-dependent protein deacylase [Deltaproteobacteria bacterium]